MDIYPKFIDRPPVAAGRFYSAHAEKLEIEIENMISEVSSLIQFKVPKSENVLAIIAPHAGYVFSGIVAASAFILLKDIKPRKKVFLIGSSHHTDFNGASIYNVGNYITPFGKVKVDTNLSTQIIEKSDIFEFVQAAHAHEHSLEVMLPFLQYFWKDEFEIIPIIIATHQKEICKKIALELQPYFTTDNLFVISTDLSHYPSYTNATKTDKLTIDAVLTGDPDILFEQIALNTAQRIPNLSTSMCGWTSVTTLLYMSQKLKKTQYYPILYQNSGDASVYGDKDRVVGYQSLVLTQKSENKKFELSKSEKSDLLNLAKQSIKYYLETNEKLSLKDNCYSPILNLNYGAFVSIYLSGELRGCIGRLQAGNLPLYETISEMAVSSAFFDRRFSPLTMDEFKEISIEISVLTPLVKISSIDEIELGKHGIYIKKDYRSGTFLPQVALKTNWTKEEFLGHCARDKAGLGWDGWKDAEIYTYEAYIFID
jgi:AmmeMemoRadiSam system protein B/AmmeMemoRadiSam system protein A